MRLGIEQAILVIEPSASQVISEASDLYGLLKAPPVLVCRATKTYCTKGIFKFFCIYLVILSLYP